MEHRDGDAVEAAVAALLDDRLGDPVEAVVPLITVMAKSYTRGNGFDGNQPNDEIAAVITTASARLASNTRQLSYTMAAGTAYNLDVRSAFQGWSLAELAVLNRYRVRAM